MRPIHSAPREKEADFTTRQAEFATATAARDEVRSRHDGLRKARLDGFMAGFNAISLKLKEMYQMITLGGDAELELVDTLDPFSEVCYNCCLNSFECSMWSEWPWDGQGVCILNTTAHAAVRRSL